MHRRPSGRRPAPRARPARAPGRRPRSGPPRRAGRRPSTRTRSITRHTRELRPAPVAGDELVEAGRPLLARARRATASIEASRSSSPPWSAGTARSRPMPRRRTAPVRARSRIRRGASARACAPQPLVGRASTSRPAGSRVSSGSSRERLLERRPGRAPRPPATARRTGRCAASSARGGAACPGAASAAPGRRQVGVRPPRRRAQASPGAPLRPRRRGRAPNTCS